MERIIIADVNSLVRKGIIQILQDEYPTVEISEIDTAKSLITEVTLQDWSLVICDLEIPGGEGLKALKKIKSIRPGLPILIVSIYPVELYAIRVLKAGASGYLNKYAAPEELISAVQLILSGKKYISNEAAEKILSHINNEKQLHDLLSNKELEIFKLIAWGKPTSQIAKSTSLAATTINSYRKRIMQKLDMTSAAELTFYAISRHIIADSDFDTVE